MKNIHVLPTDKPSRIIKNQDNDFILLNTYAPNWFEINLKTTKQNIYITSDEEIKEGDWVFDTFINACPAIRQLTTEEEVIEVQKTERKIILTTDPELIKDGVQAIDDNFLEWFIKNQSCEEVEIENVYDKFLNGDKRSVSDFRKKYKINIPKEEPKQCDICKMYPRLEGTNKCEGCYSVIRYFLEQAPELKEHLLPDLRKKQETPSVGVGNQIFKIVLDEECRPNKVSIIETNNNSILNKQETLEEAAQKFYPTTTTDFICSPKLVRDGFIAGAKWQQEQEKITTDDAYSEGFENGKNWQAERMYSEEEVGELVYNIIGEYGKHYGIMIDGKMLNDLFEQFKKK